MQVDSIQNSPLTFKGPLISTAAFLEENVFLNKALLDGTVDVPFVCFANNATERKERLRRVMVNYSLCFLSPFITLPLTNRLAMKYIARLTKFTAKESNLIHISNKFLKDKNALKKGIKLLAKEKETDYSKIIEKCGGDYEKLRKKLINAKCAVLGFDFLFSAGSVTAMAFLNNAITKKETNMDGYSAEFELADKDTVKKRAEKYKKTYPLRKNIAALGVALLAISPLGIQRGLKSDKNTGLAGFIKKHAHQFDYTKGKFMKRLPLFLFLTMGMTGVALASRNETELKNNFLLNSTGLAAYFGGDILINVLLSKTSDKLLKTNIIDKNAPKTGMNKFLPSTVPIKQLKGKSQKVATANFFINLAILALAFGLGIPKLMNIIIRRDVNKSINNKNNNSASISRSHICFTKNMENFIKNPNFAN